MLEKEPLLPMKDCLAYSCSRDDGKRLIHGRVLPIERLGKLRGRSIR